MKHTTLAILFLFSGLITQAQNILTNADFELYSSCPTTLGLVANANNWQIVVESADYYNCGFTSSIFPTTGGAYSGTGYMGFASYGDGNGSAEAIGQQLAQPLVAGHTYQLSFARKRANGGTYDQNCGGLALYGVNGSLPAVTTGTHISQNGSAVLLALGTMVTNTTWQTETLTFTPTTAMQSLIFTVQYVPNCTENIFLDGLNLVDTSTACTSFSVNITAADTDFCQNESVQVCSPSGYSSYAWSTGGNTGCVQASTGGNYYVTVTDNNGCTAESNHLVITVHPLPVVTVQANLTTICGSDSTQICATSGFANYIWNTGSHATCITTKLAGNYYVTVTDANNCTAASNHLAISVHQQPPVSVSINGDTLSAYGAVTYQWYLNGNLITGADDSVYIANQSGSYTVVITDANGCGATSNPIVVTGVETFSIQHSTFSITPNPFKDEINITTGTGAVIQLTDVTGRVVAAVQPLTANCQLSTAALARGVYYLQVTTTNGERIVRQMVKQ